MSGGNGIAPWLLSCGFLVLFLVVIFDTHVWEYVVVKIIKWPWVRNTATIILCIVIFVMTLIISSDSVERTSDIIELHDNASNLVEDVTAFISPRSALIEALPLSYEEFYLRGDLDTISRAVFTTRYNHDIWKLGYQLNQKDIISDDEFQDLQTTLDLLQAGIGPYWSNLNDVAEYIQIYELRLESKL